MRLVRILGGSRHEARWPRPARALCAAAACAWLRPARAAAGRAHARGDGREIDGRVAH